MEDKTVCNIGKLVCRIIDLDMRRNTGDTYSLSEYIDDFTGTRDELDVQLIKMAGRILERQ